MRAPISPCAESAYNTKGGRKPSSCPKAACHVLYCRGEGNHASAPVRCSDEPAPVLAFHTSPVTVTKSRQRVLNAHHRATGAAGWDLLTVETRPARDSSVGSLEDDLT
ncbi:hypothetical protein NN561_013183 [Cricetulus griseus]